MHFGTSSSNIHLTDVGAHCYWLMARPSEEMCMPQRQSFWIIIIIRSLSNVFQHSNPTQWTFSGAFFFFYQTLWVWQYSYQYLALFQLLTLTEHTTKKDLVNSILVAANLSCWLPVIICQYAWKTYCCNNAQYQNFVNVPLSFCAVCCRLHLVTTTTQNI